MVRRNQKECLLAKNNGVDLKGISIYPVTDRPDLNRYFQYGIWDLDQNRNRVPHIEYVVALIKLQRDLKKEKTILDQFIDLF